MLWFHAAAVPCIYAATTAAVGALYAATTAAVTCLYAATAAAAARPGPAALSSAESASSLDCGTVTSLLAGCTSFVLHYDGAAPAAAPPQLLLPLLPAPGTACCDGVVILYAVAADSGDNWRAVCRCMAGFVRQHSSNASAIAMLPGLCGVVSVGNSAGHTFTYCRSSIP
ncbi:hypothetical protein GUJ93_ZPchr0007g3311 [Zizania palustris]|uniref:Bifunctional inhibitor/plant lipid transfer protein/seed storage helical domain-containing protein n=1 Tax=Zizania palustris TaxID=103762 RepID=A0A8J5VPZ9_ZIZPA|nr:hypothetical protein GUJ93_ZPchr0007g3311 [Zizania palustris]